MTASKQRSYHLKRLYGITEEQYDALLERQRGSCGVCLRGAGEFRTRLCVDHDHKTGEIRGLLCNYCNRRVIGRHRDPAIFDSAAKYLRVGTGWFVPPKKKKRRAKRPRKKR